MTRETDGMQRRLSGRRLISFMMLASLTGNSLRRKWKDDSWHPVWLPVKRERNVLFNNALNTFYLWLYGVRHMVKDHSDSEKGNPLPSYRLTVRVLLYAPSHRQDNTHHGFCYTSRGALAGTRNSSMGPPHEGSIRRPIAP